MENLSENSTSDSAVNKPPAYRLHTVGQIALAAFLGAPLPGFWLASRNFKALGRKKESRRSLFWGAGLTLAAIIIAAILPENFPALWVALPFFAATYSVAKHWFSHDLVEHITSGGRLASWWVSILAGLTSLILILGLIFGLALLGSDDNTFIHSKITPVQSDDAEMNQAIKTARDRFPEFWREVSTDYRRPIPVIDGSMVKALFNDPGGAALGPEHMWVSDIEYDGKIITGVLADTPHHLKSVKRGQQVNFPIERLSDWFYVEGGKAIGAFTIRVLRGRMSEEERRAHDNRYPFRFE